MDLALFILSLVILASAIAAITLRNLVHCALCFAISLLGVAGVFLWLGAEFAGFAQILVYVGAISIVVVFAILLTRGGGSSEEDRFFGRPLVSAAIALLVAAVVLISIGASGATSAATASTAGTVREIGIKLMTTHVLALEIIALILTAALLGAVTLAMPEEKKS